MRRSKRHLESVIYLQAPVEVIRIALALAEFAHFFNPCLHFLRDQFWIVDDDFVQLLRFFPQRYFDEVIDLLEVIG